MRQSVHTVFTLYSQLDELYANEPSQAALERASRDVHDVTASHTARRLCGRAFQFGQKKFRFDSILATESIFFDSIRQSDKFAACTLIFK